MNLRLRDKKYDNFSGGHDDTADSINMSPTLMRYVRNMYIKRKGMDKRNGYQDRLSAELESGASVQQIHQWDKTDDSVSDEHELLYFLNAKVIRDNGTTRSDITNSKTITTDLDREIDTEDYDGRVVITDGVNPPLVWPYDSTNVNNRDPDAGATLETMASVVGADTQFISTARTVGAAWNFLFFGAVTDIDGQYHGNRIIWNRPGRLGVFLPNDFFDFSTNDQIVGIAKHAIASNKDVILVFLRNSIYAIDYSQPTGAKFTPFRVSEETGALSNRSIVSTDEGVFFLGERGAYFFKQGNLAPTFIGKPFNNRWASVNKTYRRRFVGCQVPGRNSIMWCVPYGGTQVLNNMGIVLNYEEWHQDGPREYPAFSYFDGHTDKPFNFTAARMITESDGSKRAIVARNGRIYNFDVGGYDEDTTQGIDWGFRTPFYGPLGGGANHIWFRGMIDATLNASVTVTIYKKLFNEGVQHTVDNAVQGIGALLGSFVLGTDRLGVYEFGSLEFDLDDESRFIELECIGDFSTVDITIHAITLYFHASGTQSPYN